MKIKTDNGKTFDAHYAWGPVSRTGDLMIEIPGDDRTISEIASDFEGIQTFYRVDEHEGDMTFEGYTDLISISRDRMSGSVRIALRKGE